MKSFTEPKNTWEIVLEKALNLSNCKSASSP